MYEQTPSLKIYLKVVARIKVSSGIVRTAIPHIVAEPVKLRHPDGDAELCQGLDDPGDPLDVDGLATEVSLHSDATYWCPWQAKQNNDSVQKY